MAAVYPNLDLSQVVIDDIVPPIHCGADVVINEADDSIHSIEEEVKELDAEAVD